MTSSEVAESTPSATLAALEFGPFHYDPARREISDGRGPLRVGSRALHILAVLLEQPGRLYSREELVTRVWPRTVVEETSLRVHISALRKALGDGQDGARYIANVPGRGYSFIGEVKAAAQCREGLTATPPPAAAPALPPRLTGPIGREQVIAQIGELLARERLVSIVGAGGMGKTTVALAVADTVRAGYAQGAFLVDLSRLSDPALVVVELGQTQGLVMSPGDPLAVLETALRGKQLLIVLDNCEHVIDDVASLVDRLMRVCPGVHFLATSREPLDVEAEWVFKLPPLALPELGEPLDVQDMLAYPAIQLFVERAQAISDAFELTEAHAPAVRELCSYLDGIPLAIELAAARVDSLGVQGLLTRLESAFELLTRGRRTALSRHRTLQAVMDWSYDLLGDSERRVLLRLSVFRGSFDLNGAVTVACGGELTRHGVLEDVLSICAKSLIVLDSTADGLPLHRLLYITRLYAERRLANSDDRAEEADVHRRHARFIDEGLQRSRDAGTGMSQYHWSAALGSSIADVRAAIEWALIDENDLALGIQLTASAKRTYCDVGLVEEYLRYLDIALGKVACAGAGQDRLELPLCVATVFMMGYIAEARQRYETVFSRTRQLLRTLGSDDDRIEALFGMSTTCYGHGNYRLSLALCEEIRGLATGRFQPLAVVISDRVAALCLHALGDHDGAEPLAWRVIAFNGGPVGRQFLSEVPFGVSMRIQLSRIQWLRGDFGTAWQTLHQALEGSVDAHVFARCQTLGMAAIPMAIWRGDIALAGQWVQELWDLSERKGLAYWLAYAQAFRRVLNDEASPGDPVVDLAAAQCAPLGDTMATVRGVSPPACTQARVEEGAVGWCAPEVMRLVALDELRDTPAQAMAKLDEAMRLAEGQGARFWMLRIALTQAAVGPAEHATAALARLQQLLSSLDDGSAIPELKAAMALLGRRT